ncbi:MAG TPA: hypothetical protein VHD32_13110 [Candidatus Didemnitutus sp.]|nr:hypothetical protein [Candidatus Didemnitutus sp.]
MGRLVGEYTVHPAQGASANGYICDLDGQYVPAMRVVQFFRGQWRTPPPDGVDLPQISGVFDPKGTGQIKGNVRGRSGFPFVAVRDAAESAGTAGGKAGRNGSAPPSVQSTAALAGNSRNAVDGVYVGTYGSNPDDTVTAKLYVKFVDDGSVNGTLSGLFTFDVPPTPGARPVTYTYKLIGVGQTGNTYPFQFWSVKPIGQPPPDAYAITRLSGGFAQGPLVDDGKGGYQRVTNRDGISGQVIGTNNRITNKFELVRDKGASADLDHLMAVQASAPGSVATTTAPARRANPSPSSAASNDIDSALAAVRSEWVTAPTSPGARPDIQGVFNGTYTREGEAPAKFKLTIKHNGTTQVIDGMATIYLATDSGTKAYTYSLRGSQDGGGTFHLLANEWETIPPTGFKNFKGMGFEGRFLSNLNQNTGRIVSVEATGSFAALCVPQFEATWDAAESADINGTIAAQKAVGNADEAAALQARAEMMKNARPTQLAPAGLVRKSATYWAGSSDFLREVFDGGFADDVDEDPDFRGMFVAYVDLFSEKCAAFLPADHRTLTITTVTTTWYAGGGGPHTETSTKSVEIDSRFIPKYVEYSGVPPAPGSEQEKEQTTKTFAIAGQILHAGGASHGTSPADANALLRLMAAHGGLAGAAGMDRFFAREVKAAGPSAALRQLGENFLRGATGQPSLQDAGATIAGAAAESDRDLPPGRFLHLVDAAHAFYRDPAHARLGSRFETAFDESLAAKYRNLMTPEEEYYYANDFEHRFRDQIMQPRERCTDPAWPRLHPAVEECIAELQ